MDHEREVRIRLTVAANEQAKAQAEQGIKDTLTQVESAAKSASQAATDAVTGGFREIKRAQTGVVRNWGPVIRDAGRYNMSLEALSAGLGKADQASLELYLANQKVGGSMDTSADSMQRYTQASLRSQIASEQLGIQFSRATSAAFQMARGVAFLAASNDENFQKMVRWLVTIQGGFDALSGGVRLVSTLSRMWRSYETAIKGAAAAHAALAAAQGVSAVAGGGAAVAAGAAGTAAAKAGISSATGTTAALAGWTFRGALMKGIGTGIGGLKAGGAAVASPVGMGIGAGLGVGAAGYSAYSTGMDAYQYGLGGGGAPGGWSDTIGSSRLNPWTWNPRALSYLPEPVTRYLPGGGMIGDYRGARQSGAAYERMHGTDKEYKEAKAAREKQAETEDRLSSMYSAARLTGAERERELQFARPGMKTHGKITKISN